jgi:hypothetical protein
MASMPYYMSQGANELAAKGVEKAVDGLREMTMLSVTGVEEIVIFVIDMMTSTYGCLITMAVDGTIDSSIDILNKSQASLNTDIKGLGGDISSAVASFENLYNAAVNDVKQAVSTFGTSVTFPSLDLSKEMTTLKNLKLPTGLTPLLDNIKANLPTFQQVQNDTNNLIRTPFEFAKSEIQQNLGNYTFDRSVFPVPTKEALTFCSDNNGINDFFDELVHITAIAKTAFIGITIGAAILVCIPMAWREIKRWRTMQERSQLVQSNAHDPMDVVYIVSRPYTSTAGIKVASTFKRTRRQILTRWVFAYITSDAALFVLSLALAGLLSVACQAILLKSLVKEVPDLTNQVGAFADKVIAQLNDASTSWAVGTNSAVSAVSQDINQKMVGWVNVTTSAVDEALNNFVDETTLVLNETFGGTILYTPILDVLKCLAFYKVEGIQKALNWVSENAQVNFPTLPSDLFSLGAVAAIASNSSDPSNSFLASPGDQASDKISATVEQFLAKLEDTIRTEAIVASCILAVWLIIVLIAVIRASTLWCGRDKTRGEGGAPVVDEFRSGPNPDHDFEDMQMSTVKQPLERPYTPAPIYSEPDVKDQNPFVSNDEDDFDGDQKHGYAGQRNVSRHPTGNGRGRIMSTRGEIDKI